MTERQTENGEMQVWFIGLHPSYDLVYLIMNNDNCNNAIQWNILSNEVFILERFFFSGVQVDGVPDKHVGTSNIIWKFDEEILRNGKIIADFKLSWQNLST